MWNNMMIIVLTLEDSDACKQNLIAHSNKLKTRLKFHPNTL